MFHGGFVQLLIGFYELFRNNLFGATAFSSYGAFWMGWGLYHILAEVACSLSSRAFAVLCPALTLA